MHRLTFVYATYNNPGMLEVQFDRWAAYPEDLRKQVEFIVVDDGSRVPVKPRAGLPLRVYRVTEDRPWHQDGARNLGAHVAREGWVFFGDMDHVVSAPSLRAMLALEDEATCYRFPRRLVSGAYALAPAVNIFACTRAMFWRVGGYDERYCGAYGSDRVFMDRMGKHARRQLCSDAPIDVYLPEQVPDCATVGLERTGPANAERLRQAREQARGKDPLVLNFEWFLVQ